MGWAINVPRPLEKGVGLARSDSALTFSGHVILKLQSPVAHLLDQVGPLGCSLSCFLRLQLVEVDGAVVPGDGHGPGLCLVVWAAEHLCQHASPRDEVGEEVLRSEGGREGESTLQPKMDSRQMRNSPPVLYGWGTWHQLAGGHLAVLLWTPGLSLGREANSILTDPLQYRLQPILRDVLLRFRDKLVVAHPQVKVHAPGR